MSSPCRPATHRSKKWPRQHTSPRRRWQSSGRLSAKLVSAAKNRGTAEVWTCGKLSSHGLTDQLWGNRVCSISARICSVTATTESPFPAPAGLPDETTSAHCRALASWRGRCWGSSRAPFSFMKKIQELYSKECWKYCQVFSQEYCLFMTNYWEGKKVLFQCKLSILYGKEEYGEDKCANGLKICSPSTMTFQAPYFYFVFSFQTFKHLIWFFSSKVTQTHHCAQILRKGPCASHSSLHFYQQLSLTALCTHQ